MFREVSVVELLTDAVDAWNVKRKGSAPTMRWLSLTFANAPTITGRDAMLDQMTLRARQGRNRWLNPLINVWQEDWRGGSSSRSPACGASHDDREVKINACSIFTLVDGKFTDQRI